MPARSSSLFLLRKNLPKHFPPPGILPVCPTTTAQLYSTTRTSRLPSAFIQSRRFSRSIKTTPRPSSNLSLLLSRSSALPSSTPALTYPPLLRAQNLATMPPIERLTDHLEKPALDDREYRVIRLPNKLEALLVHDPDTDKASAAANVNVGNFSDDDTMPGMAHAVEHLLFMGTEKVRCLCLLLGFE